MAILFPCTALAAPLITASDAEVALYDSGNDKVFSLDDDGANVFLRTSDGRSMLYDVPTGEVHVFRINEIQKIGIGNTEIDIHADLDLQNT